MTTRPGYLRAKERPSSAIYIGADIQCSHPKPSRSPEPPSPFLAWAHEDLVYLRHQQLILLGVEALAATTTAFQDAMAANLNRDGIDDDEDDDHNDGEGEEDNTAGWTHLAKAAVSTASKLRFFIFIFFAYRLHTSVCISLNIILARSSTNRPRTSDSSTLHGRSQSYAYDLTPEHLSGPRLIISRLRARHPESSSTALIAALYSPPAQRRRLTSAPSSPARVRDLATSSSNIGLSSRTRSPRKRISMALSAPDPDNNHNDNRYERDEDNLRGSGTNSRVGFVDHDNPMYDDTGQRLGGRVPSRTSTFGRRTSRQPLPREFRDNAYDISQEDDTRMSRQHSLDGSIANDSGVDVSSGRSASRASGQSDLTTDIQTQHGRRQSLRGGSAESALGLGSGRSLVGEGLRAAGLTKRDVPEPVPRRTTRESHEIDSAVDRGGRPQSRLSGKHPSGADNARRVATAPEQQRRWHHTALHLMARVLPIILRLITKKNRGQRLYYGHIGVALVWRIQGQDLRLVALTQRGIRVHLGVHGEERMEGERWAWTRVDLVKSAEDIVGASERLNELMKSGTNRALTEQIDAEVGGNSSSDVDLVEVWRSVGGQWRDGLRVSDELVRSVTSFLLGVGRVVKELGGETGGGYTGDTTHGRSMSLDEEHLRGPRWIQRSLLQAVPVDAVV
ncbi:poly(ADP)-ribose polymerase PARP [Salix suchowensis]|nr:poly(ADP)-ribose polymerase PARP [Salix suchowensis]